MTPMPSACASRGDASRTGRPSSDTSPSSGCSAPVRILTSVDLPAPFSPSNACTSPRARPKSTASSATPPTGPTKRKQAAVQNREARRIEIRRAAADLFEANGYFETSVNDIAELLGMSKATIYHYFSSKEEILFSIHDAFTTRLLAEHE